MVKLTFSPASPHKHLCPVCKGSFQSKEMDKAWVTLLNLWQIETAWSASILALAEKNKEFADIARKIIMGYTQRYSDYPERNFQNWT